MVRVQTRSKYFCDLESELDLAWGEGALAYCKENGGRWWAIRNSAWEIKTFENQPPSSAGYDGDPTIITQDSTHRFVSDTEKTTWNGKQDALGFTPANSSHNHDSAYEAKNANIQAHIASAHAPNNAQKNSDITKSEIEAKLTGAITSHTHPNQGYAINVQALTSSPADAATIYFGMLPKAPTTTAGISRIYFRAAGTIKRVEIYCYSGTAGTNESWSLYVRKNNTTDTLIATVSLATSERIFSNTDINIPVADGDYVEIKSINPTWVTNPLTCIFGGYLYIE